MQNMNEYLSSFKVAQYVVREEDKVSREGSLGVGWGRGRWRVWATKKGLGLGGLLPSPQKAEAG